MTELQKEQLELERYESKKEREEKQKIKKKMQMQEKSKKKKNSNLDNRKRAQPSSSAARRDEAMSEIVAKRAKKGPVEKEPGKVIIIPSNILPRKIYFPFFKK